MGKKVKKKSRTEAKSDQCAAKELRRMIGLNNKPYARLFRMRGVRVTLYQKQGFPNKACLRLNKASGESITLPFKQLEDLDNVIDAFMDMREEWMQMRNHYKKEKINDRKKKSE